MYIIAAVVISAVVIIVVMNQNKRDRFLPPPYQQPQIMDGKGNLWYYDSPPYKKDIEYREVAPKKLGDAITIPLPMGPQASGNPLSYGQQSWNSAPSGRTRVLLGINSLFDKDSPNAFDVTSPYGGSPVVRVSQSSLDINNPEEMRINYRNIDYETLSGSFTRVSSGVYNPPNPRFPSYGPVPAGSLKQYNDTLNRRFTFDPEWKLIGILTRISDGDHYPETQNEEELKYNQQYNRSEIMNIHRRDIAPDQDIWEYLAEDRDGFKIRLRNTRYIEDGDVIGDIPGKPGRWKTHIYSENRWIFL